MAMDIRALRYFVETARLRSFTQAAASLFVTQSTISKMVRQLEEEVGQPLLIREGKQVRLTDVGRVVYERGQEALGVVHRLQLEVADLSSLGRGQLTVGIPPMANLFFSPAVSAFRQRYPNLELRLAEHGGHLVEQQVASGELEVGATVLPGDSGLALASRQFASHPIWVAGPRKAKWAKGKTVTLAALRDEPLVLLNDDFSLTRKLRLAFLDARIEPRIVAQSGHWDFLASMAAAGLGTTFLPRPLLAKLHIEDDLAVARLVEPDMDWALAHIWQPGRYLSHAARAWLDVCSEVLGA
ncbi:LysR family transcriptional regulator [Cupriavidus sp. USMAA2-4]|uniref:LysR family transcriptional regulator n=1 Tax=Cupriavidus malaysiensis TaxID=367825 RepID=A0ABM6FE38_9BURK|nr:MULTISPECIES: LysR family transcriptional regulator [Cupriavidus]AOY94613.1 LysR family transcriptional regulator [Cupriavidus sp. USMAA2-4]AOZ02535.1 LysR family transcriptional regulator [Cupriavidus sp. USMAHM13]AOZ10110.1 LysR family transcriptional regulator [Cupriavidus malaysiensis]